MNRGYFLVFLTAIISGFSVFINKFGVNVINPYIFTGLKSLVVVLLLTSFIFLLRDLKTLKSLTGKQWFLLISIGLIGGSIPFLLFFKGLSLTSAAQGSFFHKTMFIYVTVLAVIFLKEKIDKRILIGGLFLILGNLILLKKLSFSLNQGDFFVILATLFWAVESIISKYALKEIQGRTVAWARMFFGALFIFLFLFVTGQLSLVANINIIQIRWVLITSVLLFGYVITWYSGLKYIPVSQATVILLLGSPITTLLSLFSGGRVSLEEILAGFLIVLCIIYILGLKQIWQIIREARRVIYVRA